MDAIEIIDSNLQDSQDPNDPFYGIPLTQDFILPTITSTSDLHHFSAEELKNLGNIIP